MKIILAVSPWTRASSIESNHRILISFLFFLRQLTWLGCLLYNRIIQLLSPPREHHWTQRRSSAGASFLHFEKEKEKKKKKKWSCVRFPLSSPSLSANYKFLTVYTLNSPLVSPNRKKKKKKRKKERLSSVFIGHCFLPLCFRTSY